MKKRNYIISYPAHATQEQQNLMIDACYWFLNRYNMQYHGNTFDAMTDGIEDVCIVTNSKTYKEMECWGQCYEWDDEGSDTDYVIDIDFDQKIRDLIATIFHECVHLLQWERGTWKGEGEREAEDLQYELADEYWKCGNV